VSSVTPESPYAPPQAPLQPERGVPPREELASRGQRFLDSVIDGWALIFLTIPFSVIAGSLDLGGAGSFALLIFINLGYYFGLELALGVTAGKLLTGVRVVSEDGKPASAGQIAIRTLARVIPFEALSFLFRSHPVGWHDSLSRTRVIRAR
jgi:uncharacterized RDD family membrane protein YckC